MKKSDSVITLHKMCIARISEERNIDPDEALHIFAKAQGLTDDDVKSILNLNSDERGCKDVSCYRR